RDFVHRPDARNPAQYFLLVVVIQKRRGLFRVNFKSLANHRLDVVVALNQLTTAFVALADDLGRLELHMIAGTTGPAGPTAGQPFDQIVFADLDRDNAVDLLADVFQDAFKRIGLGRVAREAVEDETLGAIRLFDSFGDE